MGIGFAETERERRPQTDGMVWLIQDLHPGLNMKYQMMSQVA